MHFIRVSFNIKNHRAYTRMKILQISTSVLIPSLTRFFSSQHFQDLCGLIANWILGFESHSNVFILVLFGVIKQGFTPKVVFIFATTKFGWKQLQTFTMSLCKQYLWQLWKFKLKLHYQWEFFMHLYVNWVLLLLNIFLRFLYCIQFLSNLMYSLLYMGMPIFRSCSN